MKNLGKKQSRKKERKKNRKKKEIKKLKKKDRRYHSYNSVIHFNTILTQKEKKYFNFLWFR